MKTNKIVGLLLAISMLFTLVCPAFAEAGVSTNKTEYKHGDVVTVTTPANTLFRVVNPDNVELFEALSKGTYTFKIPTADDLTDEVIKPIASLYTTGTYKIMVGSAEAATFKISSGSSVDTKAKVEWKTSNAKQNDTKNIFKVTGVKDIDNVSVAIEVTKTSATGTSVDRGNTGYLVRYRSTIQDGDITDLGKRIEGTEIYMTFKKTGVYYVHVTVTDGNGKVLVDDATRKISVSANTDTNNNHSSGTSINGGSQGNGGGTGTTTNVKPNPNAQTSTSSASGYIGGQPAVSSTVAGALTSGQMTAANMFAVNVMTNGTSVTSFTGFDPVKVSVPYVTHTSQNPADLVVVDSYGNVVPRTAYINGAIKMGTKNVNSPYTVVSMTASFNDVYAEWAKAPISALAVRNIINGVGDNNFDPDRAITRAEFVKMIVTMFDVYDSTSVTSFTDVQANAWYAPYIGTAAKYGITNGRGDGTFDPNAQISRQEMSAMLYRAAETLGVAMASANGTTFADDASIAAYAKAPVYSMQAEGILKGVGDNNFDPLSPCTRAQGAVAIFNMLATSLK